MRSRIVGVRVREVVSRQERVLRGRPDQASHVVVGNDVGARGIGHLLDLAHQIVNVVRAGRIRIRLAGQPVQRVPSAALRTGSAVLNRSGSCGRFSRSGCGLRRSRRSR